eukprot:6336472-Pyramimonas_sp.AAC.1
MRTPDAPEPQVCACYDDDVNLRRHHRVPLRQLCPGVWVPTTPDGEVETLDLSKHEVGPLGRASPFPAWVQGQVCAFDGQTSEDIEALREEARGIAL